MHLTFNAQNMHCGFSLSSIFAIRRGKKWRQTCFGQHFSRPSLPMGLFRCRYSWMDASAVKCGLFDSYVPLLCLYYLWKCVTARICISERKCWFDDISMLIASFGKFFRHIRPINCIPDLTSSSSKSCANLYEKLSRISNCIESQNSSANEEKWEKNPFLEIAETENCFFFLFKHDAPNISQSLAESDCCRWAFWWWSAWYENSYIKSNICMDPVVDNWYKRVT